MADHRAARHRFGPLLLFIAALLVVAVLASNLAHLAEPLSEVTGVPQFASVSDLLPEWFPAALVWAISLTFLVLAIVVLLWTRGQPQGKRISLWQVLARILGVILLIALLFLWPEAQRGAEDPAAIENGTATAPGATASGTGGVVGLVNSVLVGYPVIILIIVIAALAFALATASRRRRASQRQPVFEPERPGPEARAEVARTVDQAIEDLELGLEPREAILRCYAALCAILVQHGLGGLEPLTPREVERVALAQFHLSEEDIGALTSLFEEARYSVHSLGPPARERALLGLGRVRAALGA